MKNILNKNEFSQLKELQLINESMDFSNKTGWSDSLIGRAVNKLFSFGSKQVQIVILNRLKTKLDDQYLLGVLESCAKNEIIIEEGKSNIAEISIVMTNKNTKKELIPNIENNVIIDKIQKCIYIFKFLKDTKFEDYDISITTSVASIWEINGIKNKQIEKIEDLKDIIVTSESGEAKQTYLIKLNDYVENNEENLKAIGTGDETIRTVDKKEIKYNIIKNDINIVEEDKNINDLINSNICYNKYDYSLMIKLYKSIEYQIKNGEEYLSLLETSIGADESWIKNKDILKESFEKIKKLPEAIKEKANKSTSKEKYSEEKINEVIKGLKNEEAKKAYEYIMKLKNEIIKKKPNYKDKITKSFHIISFMFHPDHYKNYTDTQRYISFENFKKTYETVLESISSLNFEMIYEKEMNNLLKDFNMINESKIFGNNTIKNIFKDYKKSNSIEKYKDIDADKMNLNEIKIEFDKNPKMRQDAIDAVNKEALKEIALRAQWLYDTEKYEDKRNTHYSRVNFTTTNMDQKKLENKWLKLISNSKNVFASFFSANNNMPQELDPIALINSDKDFKTKWNQYSEEEIQNHGHLGKDKIEPDDPSVLKKLKLHETNVLNENQMGLLNFRTNDYLMQLSMLVVKIELKNGGDKIQCFKFAGLFNYQKIYSEVLKNINDISDDQIEKIITKYNYSGLVNIEKNIEDIEKQNQVKALYDNFRPSRSKLFHDITQFDYDKDKLATFYLLKTNPISGRKAFTQLNITDNRGSWITQTTGTKQHKSTEAKTYIKYDSATENDIYNFNINVDGIKFLNSVDIDFWDSSDKNQANKKTKLLTSKPELIKRLFELMYK
jgi:hypothetical protein